jgi:hypothetical protein
MIHLPEAILHLHVVHPISKEVPVMINQSTVETLRSMRLSAMAQSFEDQLNNSATYSSLSFEERCKRQINRDVALAVQKVVQSR